MRDDRSFQFRFFLLEISLKRIMLTRQIGFVFPRKTKTTRALPFFPILSSTR